MLSTLRKLKQTHTIGFVGGSDYVKQLEQLGEDGCSIFDYAFAENGLHAMKNGQLLASESFIGWLGEQKYQTLVNFILHYIASLELLPVKRGTFVEFRNGMINVSPIGRNCSREERNAYEQFDLKHSIRATFVEELKKNFGDYSLTYSIGGQISFDVFPTGWDKTYVYMIQKILLILLCRHCNMCKSLKKSTFLETRRTREGMTMVYIFKHCTF